MLSVRPDCVVQPGGRLEHELALAARADEARQLTRARHLCAAAADLRAEAVLAERVETVVERAVERDLDVGLAREPDQRAEVVAIARLDRLDLATPSGSGTSRTALSARSIDATLAERGRRPDEPREHERVRARRLPARPRRVPRPKEAMPAGTSARGR